MKISTGRHALIDEALQLLKVGTEHGFANPQSMATGNYSGKEAEVNGIKTIDLTRLDYLSLGQSREVRAIMKDCIDTFNISCPTSQMALKSESTVRLEHTLADFHGMKDSVIYLSGYCTNESIMQVLALRTRVPHLAPYLFETRIGELTKNIPTEFFIDQESHYSLQLSIKMSKLKARGNCLSWLFPTMDYDKLVEFLKRSREKRGDNAVRVIVSDTVSSMSGKIYDVRTLCDIAEEYDCFLYLDEAHAVGTLGNEGQGLASSMADFERFRDRLFIMGTLTKAIAQLGGYVAVSDESLSRFFRGLSPQYIFSAPLSPWMAEVVIRTIELIRGDYGKNERRKLAGVSSYMRGRLIETGFEILESESQIVPVFIGEEEKSIQAKAYLEQNGFTASLFMCPAVPKGQSILRFSLCSDITAEEVDRVVGLLIQAREKFRF